MIRRGSRQGAGGALGGDVTGASRSGGVVPDLSVGVGGDPTATEPIKSELRRGIDDGEGETRTASLPVGVGGFSKAKLAGAEAGGMGSTADCL